jgi:hypothetical protein
MPGEVPRTVLKSVVIRQEDRGAVADSVFVQDAVQPGLLPQAQAELIK